MRKAARVVGMFAVSSAMALIAGRTAFAGLIEVSAADATPAALNAAGFGGLNGNNVQVGVEEANNGQPLASNPFLPNNIIVIPNQSIGQAPQIVTNHATAVTGVIVAVPATPGNNQGIAPGAIVQAASMSTTTEEIQNAQRIVSGNGARAHLVNMSFSGLDNGNTYNGMQLDDQWIDWSARSGKGNGASPNDNLFVISAGNSSGAPLSPPADSYNGLTVGSTGVYNGAGNLVYNQFASYTSQTVTADVGANTPLGRIKTDLVAPGGDPGPDPLPAAAQGTFNAPPAAINQFVSTSGQRWELIGTTTVAGNTRPIYLVDDMSKSGLTNGGYYIATDDTAPFVAGGPNNFPKSTVNAPAGLGGNDELDAGTLAGTSFAAPIVSGGAALLQQYGTLQGFSTDHRVIKVLLLNGATKTAPGGGPLLDNNGAPWGPALDPNHPFNNKISSEYPIQYEGVYGSSYTKFDPFTGGTVPIKIGLDPQLGTGQMDVVASLKNYRAGQQVPGIVKPVGWDLNNIQGYNFDNPTGAINIYRFNTGAGQFSGSLTWDRIVTINDTNANGVWDPGETFNATNAAGTQVGNGSVPLTDLDLELFQVVGNTDTLVDFSTSDIDNVEHIFTSLSGGTYDLEVLDRTTNQGDTYALAWSVPEPGTVSLLLLGLPLLAAAGRARYFRLPRRSS